MIDKYNKKKNIETHENTWFWNIFTRNFLTGHDVVTDVEKNES